MNDTDAYAKDLQELEAAIGRIRDRLFAERNPDVLNRAISRHYMETGKWPTFKQYWEVLIRGLRNNIQKQGK